MTSGTTQLLETRSKNRSASAMSVGLIISSGDTDPLTKSVMSVSTNPGANAVDLIPSAPSSLFIAVV